MLISVIRFTVNEILTILSYKGKYRLANGGALFLQFLKSYMYVCVTVQSVAYNSMYMSACFIDKLYQTCSGVCPGQRQNIQPIKRSELHNFLGKLLIGQLNSRAA